jgi:hypothetical protein
MGKTYRHQPSGHFDDDRHSGKRGKHPNHASGRKSQGMKVLNSFDEESEEFFFDPRRLDDDDELNTHRGNPRR